MELWDHVQWKKFKDGWPNIFIDNVADIAGRDGEHEGNDDPQLPPAVLYSVVPDAAVIDIPLCMGY